MLSGLKKLITSNGTLVLLAIASVPYLLYSLWSSVPSKEWHRPSNGTRTVEEMINTPQPYIPSEPWDKDFKSSIEPVVYKRGYK